MRNAFLSRLRIIAVIACASCATTRLEAAQPYVTDDARLLPAGACQLEIGKRILRGSREAWVLPACNAFGNMELTLGTNKANAVDSARTTDFVVQAKGLIRELKPDDYGLGWVGGVETHRHPQFGQPRHGSIYAAGIYSHSFLDDAFFIHANLGARRLRDERKTALTWALAAEYNVNERVAVLAEASDTTRSRHAYQAGLWFSLVPDRIELDVSVGGDAQNFRQTRYWTVGARFITPPFLK